MSEWDNQKKIIDKAAKKQWDDVFEAYEDGKTFINNATCERWYDMENGDRYRVLMTIEKEKD